MTASARFADAVVVPVIDLDATTEQLSFVADWKADLQRRIHRAQLIFMLLDVDHDFGSLAEEVQQFKRICRALSWRAGA
jgi:hypothetical protein